jgi:mRNA-degrading endonuclease RelE of RelBE toxin-antitoxin system
MRIIDEIENQLKYQPGQETRKRKRLRPNNLAEWELKVDKFRVFYDIDEENNLVKVEAVGYKKGNKLFIHGEEYLL